MSSINCTEKFAKISQDILLGNHDISDVKEKKRKLVTVKEN